MFPLAPLAEQRRIVEAIEQQLTRLDAGVASLKRTQAGLRRYKAAVLKAACEGRLVPQDPGDEPAGALLRRILDERRAKWEAEQIARGKDPRKMRYEEPLALTPGPSPVRAGAQEEVVQHELFPAPPRRERGEVAAPLTRADLDDFVACFHAENRHERKPTWSPETPEGRWRSYTYDELLTRDKVSLDIFWLRDKTLEDSASLPDPDVLATEIVQDLQAALAQFAAIAEDLGVEQDVGESL